MRGSTCQVKKYSSSGVLLLEWEYTIGACQGGGIATDSSNNIYLTDYSNHRILKFNSAGDLLTSWGNKGPGDGEFNNPRGIAVDTGGKVYVVDNDNQRVQKFDSNGSYIAKWGSFGNNPGQFNNPWAVAVDNFGGVFVTDIALNRVSKFSSGKILGATPTQVRPLAKRQG